MDNPKNVIIKQKVELAIKTHKLLKFDYVAKNLEVTKDRLIEPIIFLPQKGDPNRFAGNDFIKQEQRQFSFEGVQNLELVDYDKAYGKT